MRLAQEAQEAKRKGDQRGAFIATNRRDLALHTASDLKELRTRPERFELPWPSRERLRRALQEALNAMD